jgi:ADP-dependent NAD(P)H-hydrate dehydratase / NAD(P)H-hydrate epimerase
MRAAYRADEVQAAEAELMATLPDGALMARAATGLAIECVRLLGTVYGRRVVLLVGAGNNGGDALYAGAMLARRGARVDAVLLTPERAHEGGRAALVKAGGRTHAAAGSAADSSAVASLAARAAIAGAELILDGIVGIGGHGGLRAPADELVAVAERGSATIVAVDVPSGVEADTGIVDGNAVHADVTVTFGALKPGLLVGAGAEHCGEVRWVDIGLGPHLPPASVFVLEADDVAAELPPPGESDDKYTRGVVGVVSGSNNYPGAAVLSTGAALHGGAGMVRYVGAAADAVRARWPEAVVHPSLDEAGRVQAWVIGPGLGTDEDAARALEHVLAADVPVLVDADAITLLADRRHLLRDRTAPTVLTPHDREFERLFGPVGPDRIAAARRAAADSGATVLLKGNATVIADPSGDVYVNRTGTPWLGTAGSGDVLSGLGGSILAGLANPDGTITSALATRAAATAAYIHGVAGQIAALDGPPTAADVLSAVRAALRSIAGAPRPR